MKDIEIQLVKNKLMKLGIQIEYSIEIANTEKIKEQRKDSLSGVFGALELIYDLQMSLSRSNMKVKELNSKIEFINQEIEKR